MDAISNQCPLPEDHIIEILLRLPVQSLLRFQSVCKQWLTIIRSPCFMNRHFHHESNHTRLLVYTCHYVPTKKPFDPEDNTFAIFQNESLETYDTPKRSHVPHVIWSINGPCKGIFCVRSVNFQVALWNMATRRLRVLPTSQPKFFQRTEVGFGIDPLTNEFKVVLIHCNDPYGPPLFAVYTSRANSWRCFHDEAALNRDESLAQTRHGNTFLNGYYHWYKSNIYTDKHALLAMDMHNEVFQEIEMPHSVRKGTIDMHICNGSLGLFSSYGDGECHFIDVWVMKEKGCWTKMASLDPSFKFQNLLGFWKSSGIFLLIGWELILYDLYSSTRKNVPFEKRGGGYNLFWPYCYKESLFSVNEGYEFHDHGIRSAESHDFFIKKPWR